MAVVAEEPQDTPSAEVIEKSAVLRAPATAAALAATLGLAAASWVVAVRQMNGMDMGVATQLGSFAFFVALWVCDDGGDDAAGRGPGRL